MKNISLAFQIWITFALSMLISLVIIGFVYTRTIRNFSEQETFENILTAQQIFVQNVLDRPQMRMFRSQMPLQSQDIRTVHHFIFLTSEKNEIIVNTVDDNETNKKMFDKMISNIITQNKNMNNYILGFEKNEIFYIARKIVLQNNHEGYLVSYMLDSYKKEIEQALISRLIFWASLSMILVLVLSIILSKNLIKPLNKLQNIVKNISKKDWSNPVDINRRDEIGDLADSIELMRKELIYTDKKEREFIQYVSHELKTPLMVIRSYIQSIEDGIYPKSNLAGSLEVIDEEAQLLEKRIHDLLYYSKLDYLYKHEKNLERLNLRDIYYEIHNKILNKDIEMKVEMKDFYIFSIKQHWEIIFQNILDNHLRYTKSIIDIKSYYDENNNFIIDFFNDGEKIDNSIMKNMLNPYNKGKNGKSGLGLVIVEKILNIYKSKIQIMNTEKGVLYKLKIDINNNNDKKRHL